MDRFPGYYRRIHSDDVEQLTMTEAETRLQTRTGINRATGTVQESILYSRQVFEEHTRFWGMVHVEDELVGRQVGVERVRHGWTSDRWTASYRT